MLMAAIENGADGKVSANLAQVGKGGFHQFLVDLSSIAHFRKIASGFRKQAQKIRLKIYAGNLVRELDYAAGIEQDLGRFDAADLFEKPAATGEHEHGMPLHFEQLEQGHDFLWLQLAPCMPGQKTMQAFQRAVQKNLDVVIAGGPGIMKQSRRLLFKQSGGAVAQTIERHAQRTPPLLVPSRAAKIAAAVFPPASHAMHTAPGGVFNELDLMAGRKFLQKFAVVGKAGRAL